LEHESGAQSTLNASYASAGEYYLMNIYGKESTAYYDVHQGVRIFNRSSNKSEVINTQENDAIADELDEFAAAVRGEAEVEMDGEKSTTSLAVILAGIKSAREGRRVEVSEILR